jgi:hypothetical protein
MNTDQKQGRAHEIACQEDAQSWDLVANAGANKAEKGHDPQGRLYGAHTVEDGCDRHERVSTQTLPVIETRFNGIREHRSRKYYFPLGKKLQAEESFGGQTGTGDWSGPPGCDLSGPEATDAEGASMLCANEVPEMADEAKRTRAATRAKVFIGLLKS